MTMQVITFVYIKLLTDAKKKEKKYLIIFNVCLSVRPRIYKQKLLPFSCRLEIFNIIAGLHLLNPHSTSHLNK